MNRLIILLTLLSNIVFAQENSNIDKLYKSKDSVKRQIKSLEDTLVKIDNAIANEKAKQFLKNSAGQTIYGTTTPGAKLKKSPDPIESPFMTFSTATKVRILDYSNGYFGIRADTAYGYMNELWIVKDSAVKKFYDAKILEENMLKNLALEKDELEKKKQEQRYIKAWGKAKYDRVKRGEYWIGMTREIGMLSLGYPDKINSTVGSWGVHEQWVYKNGTYLYFENDILTSYQH